MKTSAIRDEFNREDPDAWLALKADSSLPMTPNAKIAWIKDSQRWTRQFLFPVCYPFLKILMAVIQLYKAIVPNGLTSSPLLHRLIVKGLKTFVTPEGNYLLVRHFHLGSQVLEFLKDNIPGTDIKTNPLYPKSLDEFKEDLILIHDINLYNFIIDLNIELEEKGIEISQVESPNFDSIHEPEVKVEDFPNGPLNFIDIQTAIEFILPLFQFLLTDRQFWRSTHSLQLDETIGLYFAKILGLHNRLFLVNNKHPMVPANTGEAGQRLVLHSLSTEVLHAMLLNAKNGKQL